jgi:drug/metabolite transporter (DMT)-like permease
MTSATQRDFGAELGKLRASNNSGPMDRSVSVLGVLLAIVGLVIIVICFIQSRSYSSILNQMDALILALFGIGLIILGSALYIRSAMTRFLRYWLLRMVYEQRDLARQHTPSPDE